MSLKEYLYNNGFKQSDFDKGYPLDFEFAIRLVKTAVDYLICLTESQIAQGMEEVRHIAYELGKKITWQERKVIMEQARTQMGDKDYSKFTIRYGICNAAAFRDYLLDEVEPSKNYELIGYLRYYTYLVDADEIGYDNSTITIEYFIKANRYDLAEKLCKQEIDCLEHNEDNPNYFDNPNYHKLKEFEKLIAEHEQEKNKNTD